MSKPVRVVLLGEAEEVYKKLNSEAENNKQSRMILRLNFQHFGGCFVL